MKEVWRIATDTPTYTANDLTGAGAKATGGRWNSKGNAVLYCAGTIALANLETVVHLGASGLPLNRYLVRIDIPDAVWAARRELTHVTAPVGWDVLPPGRVSIEYGDTWLAGLDSAVLCVPSIVVPENGTSLSIPCIPMPRWS
ncbi:Prs ADP-ribosylating toxin [Gammaproteobacteria bacterium]